MTLRAAYPAAIAARTPHPLTHPPEILGPIGPNSFFVGRKVEERGLGDALKNKGFSLLVGPIGPIGPKSTPYACEVLETGLGGSQTFHVYPAKFGPMGPIGPDPPNKRLFSKGCVDRHLVPLGPLASSLSPIGPISLPSESTS